LHMCEEGKTLITGYLDASEEYDRSHLMLLAAFRRDDPESIEGYRGLVQEARLKLQDARQRFQGHQKFHKCCGTIHFEEDSASGTVTAQHKLPAQARSSSAS
jgi:hypothetical protein